MSKDLVVVVCGYGCHLDTPLRPYLDRVGRFIGENKPKVVIFCGGQTQCKTAPRTSEAVLMLTYMDNLHSLHSFIINRSYNNFYAESSSYFTLENIHKSALFISTLNLKSKIKIVIFCEATRAPVVVMLARHFMLKFVESIDDITVETASWERADPFKQAWNLIYNKLMLKFNFLARRERERRLRRAENL